jgi:gamma-polyglutamate biosynthesis protein CapC
MSVWSLPLLPTNGLDRSLHAPVLVGLLFVTLFTETFGWTYAGLVVPGYLAATFAAAPVTAVLVLTEGWLTHLGVATVARIIPERTGAWSTAFGRERFFLYIVVAVVVRLFVEGTVVPWVTVRYDLAHSRELYSVGLVLVPLIANVFWSSGFLHAGPRLIVLTGLTYLVIDQVLLKHTNFSLSRFQVANESVALHFLDTPKAYLLLLLGAMLGARGNVQYGWDYNGILVPALLAVAWYEPLKLLGTGVEAIAIYLLARTLSDIRPFSRIALVGPRRMLFVGILGFVVKLGLGHLLVHVLPKVQLTEYLGFGYILPSLLAVKMWNKLRIGIVLMPTLQVSLTAFLAGNALGFGLNWVTHFRLSPAAIPHVSRPSTSVAFAWLLASDDAKVRPGECQVPIRVEAIAEVIERTLQRGFPDQRDLTILGASELDAVSDQGRWWLIVPRTTATSNCAMVRVALAPELLRRGGTTALLTPAEPFGSSMAIAALSIAEATSAPILIAQTGSNGTSAPLTWLTEHLSAKYSVLRLATDGEPNSRLSVPGSLPNGLDLAAIERLAESPIELRFVAAQTIAHPTLVIGAGTSERIASRYLGTALPETWPGALRRVVQSHAEELIGQSYRAPTRSEMLLLEAVVLPALESSNRPNDWALAVAQQLGYRIAGSIDGPARAWILFEPPSAARRGNATLIVRPEARRALGLEVPAPLWELGTLSYGLSMFDATEARHLLIAGVKPDAKADGSSDPRRSIGKSSYFQHIHQSILGRGEEVVAIHAIRPDVPIADDVIAQASAPVLSVAQRPRLAVEMLDVLSDGGLRTECYSASPTQVSIGAQFDPAFAFAERFAPDKMLRLWFSQRARAQISRIPPPLGAFRRILDRSPLDVDVAKMTIERLLAPERQPVPLSASKACNLDQVVERVEQWLSRNNPYDRLDAKRLGSACEWYVAVDAPTGVPWLVLLATNEARLVPLHGAEAVGKRTARVRTLAKLRRALDLGTATVLAEAP